MDLQALVLDHLDQARRQGIGGELECSIRFAAAGEVQFDMRGCEARRRLLALGPERHEAGPPGAVRIVLPEGRPQELAHRLDQPAMRPVGAVQPQLQAARSRHGLPLVLEHGHVGAAEPVDGLLGVADHEEAPWDGAQSAQQGTLPFVGVLELVCQDRPRLTLPAGAGRGTILEQQQGPRLEIVVIESLALEFQIAVEPVGLREHGPPGRHGLGQRALGGQVQRLFGQLPQDLAAAVFQFGERCLGIDWDPHGLGTQVGADGAHQRPQEGSYRLPIAVGRG